jgi:hypothetical protein
VLLGPRGSRRLRPSPRSRGSGTPARSGGDAFFSAMTSSHRSRLVHRNAVLNKQSAKEGSGTPAPPRGCLGTAVKASLSRGLPYTARGRRRRGAACPRPSLCTPFLTKIGGSERLASAFSKARATQPIENEIDPSAAARENIKCSLVSFRTGLAHLCSSKFKPSSWR